jgi:hypothetical protein
LIGAAARPINLKNSVETSFNAEIAETQRAQRKIDIHPSGEPPIQLKALFLFVLFVVQLSFPGLRFK